MASAGVGIVLEATGFGPTNGGLTVTGNGPLPPGTPVGTAPTGGRIQRKTGPDGSTSSGVGIYLNGTKSPSFRWMDLRVFDNSAIFGRDVAGFHLEDSIVEGE